MADKALKNSNSCEQLSGLSRKLILPALLLATNPGAITGAHAMEQGYYIEISKSDQELMVKRGEQLITKYRIAYGKGGKGDKRQQGDNRTPVGTYKVTNFKADSKFYFFIQINYPNLVDAWYGYKDRIINEYEFRDIAAAYKSKQVPPQDTPLGGYIGIHGLGEVTQKKLEIHSRFNWTEGCIALRNDEINELRRYITIGTPITIRD